MSKSTEMTTENLAMDSVTEDLDIKIQDVLTELKLQYLEDDLPWIVGFSGGKDSTALLQLVFYALSDLTSEQLKKEVHVLCNDTLVENPTVAKFVDEQLERIRQIGKAQLFSHNPDLFHVVKTTPKLEDTFWLNLIGKGYPSPNRWFRWCTERMKIRPTTAYIVETVSKHGHAIVLLGKRKDESSNRARSMEQYKIPGLRLSKHSLPNAYTFSPIAELTNKEVWRYLRTVKNPWGANNEKLVELYYKAYDLTAEDCPLVIDTTTPSCGNSRFGCWVCTVVQRDKSMEGLIATGEKWMQPLLKFRDWLTQVRNDESKRQKYKRTGEDRLGPFLVSTRVEILERLLEIENIVGNEFISRQELSAIQIQWQFDGNFDYSVSEIYARIKGQELMAKDAGDPTLNRRREENQILDEVCKEMGVNPNHIRALMELEREHLSFLHRRNIHVDMKSKIREFLREQ